MPTCRNRHFACAWEGPSALGPLSRLGRGGPRESARGVAQHCCPPEGDARCIVRPRAAIGILRARGGGPRHWTPSPGPSAPTARLTRRSNPKPLETQVLLLRLGTGISQARAIPADMQALSLGLTRNLWPPPALSCITASGQPGNCTTELDETNSTPVAAKLWLGMDGHSLPHARWLPVHTNLPMGVPGQEA